MITEKAKYFHGKLNINSECKYSSGWLEKFKNRHGIRRLKSTGEKECADYVSATMFVEDLNEYIKNEQLTTEQIYNADETGLFWKCLPQNSLASGDEYSIEGYKESKERITALLCANAAGTHKCKLMIIGKSANPRCLKNVKYIPVVYKSNKRAWVTQELFLEWFNNNFVPEVREHLQRIGLEKNCKVLLLLDNCPAHPDVNAMISDNVTVKYLPPNCTSLIQPMDQGAIRSFKCQYRKFIVQKLVDSNSRHEFVKSLNIKSALWTAATSWDSVTPRVLNKVWNNLLSQDDENDSTFSIEIQSDVLIPPGFTADAISKWMECDIDVAPFAIVSDDEIVNMVNQTEEYELESNSEESDGGDTVETPTLAQAIEASSVLLKFLENYTGTGISEPDKIQVYRIQSHLLKEQMNSKRQTTLNEYFKLI
ncbi:jerky protein homolog-like [Anastrepha ludens]|uniref:jerky protein homolog-like n=1 Tax=Anastrepha ludens TaxID=28586 RepID=UPI0023AFE49C|nr:jerky protein homolog-like [Anastrepha ludens]